MIERIVKLMKENNLSSKEFATILEVSQAVITHITTGRNKVSLDLLMRIKRKFPEVNLKWLIFGESEMYEAELKEEIQENRNEVKEPKNKAVEIPFDQNMNEIEKVIILYKNGVFKDYKQL